MKTRRGDILTTTLTIVYADHGSDDLFEDIFQRNVRGGYLAYVGMKHWFGIKIDGFPTTLQSAIFR